MKDINVRIRGKIVSIEGDYLKIRLDSGEEEYVSKKEWERTHPGPLLELQVEKIWEHKMNQFGFHFYGFVPEGYQQEGWG